MRNVLTAVLAFMLSTFLAGMAAVVVAEQLQAGEEFILVFLAIAPLGLIVVLPMFIASFRPEPRGAVSRVARWLVVLFAACFVALFGYAFYVAQARVDYVEDLPILASIAVPAAIILAVQWILFRWRARPAALPPMRFGRSGSSA